MTIRRTLCRFCPIPDDQVVGAVAEAPAGAEQLMRFPWPAVAVRPECPNAPVESLTATDPQVSLRLASGGKNADSQGWRTSLA